MGEHRKPKQPQRLDKAISALEGKHGARIVQAGRDLSAASAIPPHVSSGFAALDALTGCKGIPLSHITLLTGKTTSGKLTVAYRTLANMQAAQGRRRDPIAILDLTRTSDPDYIARCGIDLHHTLFARPPKPEQAVRLIYDLLHGYGLRALLVDGLGDLLKTPQIAQAFDAALPSIMLALRQTRCAMICLDEPQPPWLRWLRLSSGAIAHCASLHLDLRREQWLTLAPTQHSPGPVSGYTARAHLLKSRWASGGICELKFQLKVES